MNEKTPEILLVEDNKSDADLIIRALKRKTKCNDNDIAWLKDGVEALDYLFARGEYEGRAIKNNPKVMLLDLKMPKVGGLKVLKEVRARKETKNLPVVILTSSNEDKDIQRCYEHGVNSYIVKPLDFNELLETVSEVGAYWLLLNRAGS